MFPQMVEIPSEDLKWENDGYFLENVFEDGVQWLQMHFQENITQFGNEPWVWAFFETLAFSVHTDFVSIK